MSSQYNPPRRGKGAAWFPLDVNEFVSVFLRSLQDRSTKAATETSTGSMIINAFVHFTVGTGLVPQSSPENSLLNWTEEQRSTFISQAERFFRMYAGSRRIDHYGRLDFFQMQAVVFRNCAETGDCLMHRSYRGKRRNYEPYVQILSGRWVRNPQGETDSKGLTGGVYLDSMGRETGYSIAETTEERQDTYTCYPVQKFNPRSGFEEYDLIRLDQREANQVRGIPLLSPVLEDIQDLEAFKAAYKAKAATQALFTGVITSEKDAPSPVVSTMDTLRGLALPRENGDALPAPSDVDDVKLGTGNIIALNPGEKLDMAESKVPATEYEKFIATELSQITAGSGFGGIPSEMALQKYSNNYSASRATIAGQEKRWQDLRAMLSSGFCDPVWEQVIDYGIRIGEIEAPGYIEGDWMYRKAVLAVTWIGPAPINIDPKAEIEAMVMAIDNNLITKEDAVRMLFGKDFEETVERRAKEMRQEDSLKAADVPEEDTDESR